MDVVSCFGGFSSLGLIRLAGKAEELGRIRSDSGPPRQPPSKEFGPVGGYPLKKIDRFRGGSLATFGFRSRGEGPAGCLPDDSVSG